MIKIARLSPQREERKPAKKAIGSGLAAANPPPKGGEGFGGIFRIERSALHGYYKEWLIFKLLFLLGYCDNGSRVYHPGMADLIPQPPSVGLR